MSAVAKTRPENAIAKHCSPKTSSPCPVFADTYIRGMSSPIVAGRWAASAGRRSALLPTLVVGNKADLLPALAAHRPATIGDDIPLIYVSAKTGQGLDVFGEQCLAIAFSGRVLATADILVSNARHADA